MAYFWFWRDYAAMYLNMSVRLAHRDLVFPRSKSTNKINNILNTFQWKVSERTRVSGIKTLAAFEKSISLFNEGKVGLFNHKKKERKIPTRLNAYFVFDPSTFSLQQHITFQLFNTNSTY